MELGKAVEFLLAHPVPIRPTSGDGDIGGCSIDSMVSVGMNSVVGTLEEIACHLESDRQLEIGSVTDVVIVVIK